MLVVSASLATSAKLTEEPQRPSASVWPALPVLSRLPLRVAQVREHPRPAVMVAHPVEDLPRLGQDALRLARKRRR